MVLFRITENEPSKMHNVRPYVYSRPCDVTEYVPSSSKDEAETKIVLTELVGLNKPMLVINTSGIDNCS